MTASHDKTLDGLLAVLRERDILFDPEELKQSLETSPEARAWIEEHVTPNTLLSKEEETIYNALQKSGQAESLLSAQQLSMIRIPDDGDIKDAIEDLKRSTSAIDKQAESLRSQQKALNILINDQRSSAQKRADATATQNKKWALELERSNANIKELTQSITYLLTDLEAQNKTAELNLKQNAAEVLRADDRLLQSFQKLTAELEPEKPELDGREARVRDLCMKLIKFTVEATRTRLDHIYLKKASPSSEKANEVEAAALQEELESLYSEILPVAQMSTEQQYLQPMLKSLSMSESQTKGRALKALDYVIKCLRFLNDRLSLYCGIAKSFTHHQAASSSLAAATRAEISFEIPASTAASAKEESRRRRSSGARPQHRRQGSSLSMEEETAEPEKRLARVLGLSHPDSALDLNERAEELSQAVTDRTKKLEGVRDGVQTAIEEAVGNAVRDSEEVVQSLLDSLLSETTYGKVCLRDQDADTLLGELDSSLKGLEKTRDEIGLEDLPAENVTREKLVERWAR